MSNFQLQRRRVSKLKKVLAIILGAIFVLSFAASAFAIHAEIPSETQAVVAKGATQITIDGEIRTRGWYQKNIDYGSNVPKGSLTGGIVNGLTGGLGGSANESSSEAWYDQRIRLSVDAKVTPNVEGYIQLESGSGQNDLYTWGGQIGSGNSSFNSKPTGISVLQAWILYSGQGLFGFPAGLKIGHMPLALGEKQFFDHTKFGDDAIVFFMDPMKELHIGLLTIKFQEQNRFVNTDDLDGYVGLAVYKLDPKNTIGINYTYLTSSSGSAIPGMSESNVELHANGDISGFTYKASVDFQFGKKTESRGDETKAKGYAALIGLGYQIDPVGIRFAGAYGSGDDEPTGKKEKQFDTFLGNDQHYTLVYEYRVNSAAGAVNTGLSNTAYLNLGLDFKPMKDLMASIDGYYLKASKTPLGADSKSIGWEIDAKAIYNIAKNLTYQVDAGVLFAGDVYKNSTLGLDAKNATVLRHTLTLSF